MDANETTRFKLETRVDKTGKEFEDQNSRLKNIAKKFRAPHKLLIDILLIMILLFMIYVLIKVINM